MPIASLPWHLSTFPNCLHFKDCTMMQDPLQIMALGAISLPEAKYIGKKL